MTPEDVRKEVEAIAKEVRDDEAAHSHEDSLHQQVLEAIANGEATDPAGCAAEALKTQALNFARWCA